jgi:hypothetical protein
VPHSHPEEGGVLLLAQDPSAQEYIQVDGEFAEQLGEKKKRKAVHYYYYS